MSQIAYKGRFIFAREVGMSPKLFCRVGRFRQALETVRQTAVPKLGAGGSGLSALRPIALDSRLSTLLKPEPYGISSSRK